MKRVITLTLALLLGWCVCFTPALADDVDEAEAGDTYAGAEAVESDAIYDPTDPNNPYYPPPAATSGGGEEPVPEGDDGGWADPDE